MADSNIFDLTIKDATELMDALSVKELAISTKQLVTAAINKTVEMINLLTTNYDVSCSGELKVDVYLKGDD